MVLTPNVKLMDLVNVMQVLKTIMEFVLNVLLELSGALLQANASMSVVKIQSIVKQLDLVNV